MKTMSEMRQDVSLEMNQIRNESYLVGLQDAMTYLNVILLENPTMSCLDLANFIEMYKVESEAVEKQTGLKVGYQLAEYIRKRRP